MKQLQESRLIRETKILLKIVTQLSVAISIVQTDILICITIFTRVVYVIILMRL